MLETFRPFFTRFKGLLNCSNNTKSAFNLEMIPPGAIFWVALIIRRFAISGGKLISAFDSDST